MMPHLYNDKEFTRNLHLFTNFIEPEYFPVINNFIRDLKSQQPDKYLIGFIEQIKDVNVKKFLSSLKS